MFSSLKIGKLFGIDCYIHSTFWLLPAFVLLGGVAEGNLSRTALDLALLFALFGCVVLHEIGHALAARRYGIPTRDITLYPIGGIASLESIPRNPLREIAIALAGPAVNLMIAAGLFIGYWSGDWAFTRTASETSVLDLFFFQLFWINLGLLVFNLIPAFPMDGGRVLRAALHLAFPRERATRIAVSIGTLLAIGMIFLAVVNVNIGLGMVGAMVFLLGQGELNRVSREERSGAANSDWEGHSVPQANRSQVLFTGLKWNHAHREWEEWHSGVIVRQGRVL